MFPSIQTTIIASSGTILGHWSPCGYACLRGYRDDTANDAKAIEPKTIESKAMEMSYA